ncbi:unnamed protein product [Anisakis simplex]|uniref:Conserved plasma membrane protein n=1 Tax=Anisakis simplex TaxID=6269 RepID=A0A0M3JVK2_ANISI|nr:unnamed protein product [Anisakis simplex]
MSLLSSIEGVTQFLSRYMPFPTKSGSARVAQPQSSCMNGLPQLSASAFDSSIVRFAGVSGALAVVLGAYGAHALRQNASVDERRIRAFETGNRYHMLHSIVLLACNRARFPLLTASFFLGGIFIFSSTCYHYSITGQDTFRRYTLYGGILFIIGWLSFMF